MKMICGRSRRLLLVIILILPFLASKPPVVNAEGVIFVKTTLDEYGGKHCSLRNAIIAANNNAPFGGCLAGNEIYVPAGEYHLSIRYSGSSESGPESGDLDITNNMIIYGAGAETTEIKADPAFDRIFHIKAPRDAKDNVTKPYQVIISGIKMYGGFVSDPIGGGGLLNDGGNVSLYAVKVEKNIVDNVGGGITNTSGSTLTIDHSTILKNSAGVGGGIYNKGNLILSNSLVYANFASESGGGISNRLVKAGESATITNSTISFNNCENGGGGISNTGDLIIKNSTIADNAGSGLQLNGYTLQIQNSIIARQKLNPNCVIKSTSAKFTSLGHNLVDINNGSNPVECKFNGPEDINNKDPKISSTVGDFGGRTLSYNFTDIHSPAIDAIPKGDRSCPAIDQRGYSRPGDGNKDGVMGCDIGAYEEGGVAPKKIKFFLPMVRK